MIDKKKMWAKLMADPGFAESMSVVGPVMMKLMDAVPELYASTEDVTVTIRTVLEARLVFLRHMVAEKHVTALVSACPIEMFDGDEEVRAMTIEGGERQVANLTWETEHVCSFDDERLPHPSRVFTEPLTAEVQAAMDNGTLTIGKLLELQPSIVLKHGT